MGQCVSCRPSPTASDSASSQSRGPVNVLGGEPPERDGVGGVPLRVRRRQRRVAVSASAIASRPPASSSVVGQPKPRRKKRRGCSNQCPGPT